MDNEWNIINTYFDNQYTLIEHQINSYNDFFLLFTKTVVELLSTKIFFSFVQNFELGFSEQSRRNKNITK